jgi:hypothetical protein
MSLLTTSQDAQLAQDVVTTVLEGALSRHGSQKAFATSAGVTPAHVNYIIKQKRMPSRKMAEWMAPFLPMPAQDQQSWVDYVHLYWLTRSTLDHELMTLIKNDIGQLVSQINAAHMRVIAATDPDEVRRNGQTVILLAESVLRRVSPAQQPMMYLSVMDAYLDVIISLGRRVDALWLARRMQWLATALEMHVRPSVQVRLSAYRLSALQREGNMLNSLGLPMKAIDLYSHIASDPLLKKQPELRQPNLYWDQLDAMTRLPRSSIREARVIWREGMQFNDAQQTDQAEVNQLLLARSYAEVMMRHGRYNDALHLLEPFWSHLDNISHFDVYKQVFFCSTFALLLWRQPKPDQARWKEVIRRAHHIASRAGFALIVWEMHKDYGDALFDAISV